MWAAMLGVLCVLGQVDSPIATPSKPNIVVILADDLGIGDVSCFNPAGKIKTPSIDSLARSGMKFTDAHSASAVCTPTRYGLITGRYCWRTRLQRHVLGGLSPRLIEPGRMTIASMLKSAGYRTACIGKWHLGMDFALKPGKKISPLSIEPRGQVFNVHYDQPIKNGPNSVGFDEYFGIAASLDMVPYAFIKNDRLVGIPSEDRNLVMRPETPDKRTRLGPAVNGFTAEGVLPALCQSACDFIARRKQQPEPFFLYIPLASPHTPIAPASDWAGKSGLGSYADFVMQTDHAIGTIMNELEKQGIAHNTLVIVTSDNGCSPEANFADLAKHDHHPSGPYRGTKADIFEGGHRVPFVVRWPGVVKPGTSSSHLVCLNDIMRTCAEINQLTLPDNAAEDSFSFLPILQGKSAGESQRSAIVNHSINGSFAVRRGNWKLCLCSGSGGWSKPRPNTPEHRNLPPVQLYDLANDVAEQTNLADKHPEKVRELKQLLEEYVATGRSTPGTPQKNAVEVKITASQGN